MKQLTDYFLKGLLIGLSTLFCAACGGPKLDPDVMKATELPSVQRKVVYLKIKGSLKDSDGNPVVGAKVVAQTFRGKWTDITTHFGSFRLDAIFSDGETIDFHFSPAKEKRNPAAVNWTVRVFEHELPKGVDRVTLNFQEDRQGIIRIASIEY